MYNYIWHISIYTFCFVKLLFNKIKKKKINSNKKKNNNNNNNNKNTKNN